MIGHMKPVRRAIAVALMAVWIPTSTATQMTVQPAVKRAAVAPNAGKLGPQNIDRSILNDPAMLQFRLIRRFLLDRAADLDRGERKVLLRAVRMRDEEGIRTALGLAEIDIVMLDESVKMLREDFLSRHPELRDIVPPICATCDDPDAAADRLNGAIDLLKKRRSRTGAQSRVVPTSARGTATATIKLATRTPFVARFVQEEYEGDFPGDPGPKDDCLWLGFGAAVLACTVTGPLVYWFCSYAAYCTFCWGPTRDYFCKGKGQGDEMTSGPISNFACPAVVRPAR